MRKRKNPVLRKAGDEIATAEGKKFRALTPKELEENFVQFRMPEESFIPSPPGEHYVYLCETPEIANDIRLSLRNKGSKRNFPFFPPFGMSAWRLGHNSTPIKDIWKKGRHSEGIIGIIRFYAHPKRKALFIDMMSVRPGWKRNGVNTLMIDAIMEDFQDRELQFSSPTPEGKRFLKAVYPEAVIVDEYNPFE